MYNIPLEGTCGRPDTELRLGQTSASLNFRSRTAASRGLNNVFDEINFLFFLVLRLHDFCGGLTFLSKKVAQFLLTCSSDVIA
jgi:hypothetical protein